MWDTVTIFVVSSAALLGATIGSFLNVCIYRMPRPGLKVSQPARSFCTGCGEGIRASDNIPLWSWMRLGGRCRACRAPISSRYFVVEALTAVIFAAIAQRFLPLILAGTFPWAACLVLLVLTSALIVAAFIDFDLQIIPDEITIGGMHLLPLLVLLLPSLQTFHIAGSSVSALGVFESWCRTISPAEVGDGVLWGSVAAASIASFVAGCFVYRKYRARFLPEYPNRFRDVSLAGVLAAAAVGLVVATVLRPSILWTERGYALGATLIGMLTGSTVVYLVGFIGSKAFRKPAMGFGDVKLMGLLGGLAGLGGAIAGLLAACVLGSIYGIGRLIILRDRYLPFGPFLTIGCLAMAIWPQSFDRLVDWYLGLFQ